MKHIYLGRNLILTPEGLAVFKNLKLAAAADLHIGFEEALGQQLARIQTKKILEKFLRVIEKFGIEEIVLDGDIKYSFGKESEQEWNEIKYFMSELLKKAGVKIAKGNHDFYIQNMIRDFDIMVSKEFEINGILFAHGDEEIKKPGETAKADVERQRSTGSRREVQQNFTNLHSDRRMHGRNVGVLENRNPKLIVIGNEHPAIKLRDEIGAIRKYQCFLYARNEKVLVLPAANPWTYGTDILATHRKGFLSPILRTIDLEEAEVYATDGQEIYDFKKVRDVRELLLKK